jgi:hypothetical protein
MCRLCTIWTHATNLLSFFSQEGPSETWGTVNVGAPQSKRDFYFVETFEVCVYRLYKVCFTFSRIFGTKIVKRGLLETLFIQAVFQSDMISYRITQIDTSGLKTSLMRPYECIQNNRVRLFIADKGSKSTFGYFEFIQLPPFTSARTHKNNCRHSSNPQNHSHPSFSQAVLKH